MFSEIPGNCMTCNKNTGAPYECTDCLVSKYPIFPVMYHECYVCLRCYQEFPRKQDLIGHMREHEAQCSVCQKVWKSTQALNRHMKTHAMSKSFPCPTCDARLSDARRLGNHIRIFHTQDTHQHLCNSCCKKFRSARSLKTHTRIMHSASKHKCSSCAAPFPSARLLAKHKC